MQRIEPSSTGSSASTGSERERAARGPRLRRSSLCSTSRLVQALDAALPDAPRVVDVRNFGMMAGIEVAPVGGSGAKGHVLQKALYDRGLNLKSTGDTLIVAPAFIAERRHIEEITGKIREALAAAKRP
jgi:adenosylmethionine-8-amino-7-oxononanoate aminotransferase